MKPHEETWEFWEDPETGEGFLFVIDAEGKRKCWPVHGMNDRNRLTAQAPAMARALKEALVTVHDSFCEGSTHDEQCEDIRAILKAAGVEP